MLFHKEQAQKNTISLPEQKKAAGLFWYDWLIFGLLAAFCYLFFGHSDIVVTAERSFLMLDGHFFDFYSASHAYTGDGGANYLPTTFWLFAVWNIPLKLFGLNPDGWMTSNTAQIMWYKLLPVLTYLGSGWLLFRLCSQRLHFGAEKAKIVVYLFLTMPFAFFSQFIFCQYDIFTVFFMLLGMNYYFKENPQFKDWLLFSLFFGLAVSCKYYAILIFFILLVLRRKEIGKILFYFLIALLPVILEASLYLLTDKAEFISQVLGFGAISFATGAEFSIGFAAIKVLPLFICILFAWSFFTKAKDFDELVCYAFYFCSGICFVLFSFMTSNPQWLLFGTVFWTVSTCLNRRADFFIFLDIICILVFYLILVTYWAGNVDQVLLKGGVLHGALAGRATDYGTTMASLFPISIDESRQNLLFTAFAAVLCVNFVFKHPRFCVKEISAPLTCFAWIRTRFLVAVLAFAIPALVCLPGMLGQPMVMWEVAPTPSSTETVYITPVADAPVSQWTTLPEGTATEVRLYTSTEGQVANTYGLRLQLVDCNTEQAVASAEVFGKDIRNGAETVFDFNDIKITSAHQYRIDVYALEEPTEKSFKVELALVDGLPDVDDALNHDYRNDVFYDSDGKVIDGFRAIMRVISK